MRFFFSSIVDISQQKNFKIYSFLWIHFVSGVRLHFYFMPELIYFLFTFHCLCLFFFVKKRKKLIFFFMCKYWKFNAFSSSFPIQCVISIVAHTHIHNTSLLISFSISFSSKSIYMCVYLYAESASIHCCCGLTQLKYCYYYYRMLCMCVFSSIISLIKLNFYRDEKCVDSNFMFILLLMTRFESIKREDEEKKKQQQ